LSAAASTCRGRRFREFAQGSRNNNGHSDKDDDQQYHQQNKTLILGQPATWIIGKIKGEKKTTTTALWAKALGGWPQQPSSVKRVCD
jgi:hypothetical protein